MINFAPGKVMNTHEILSIRACMNPVNILDLTIKRPATRSRESVENWCFLPGTLVQQGKPKSVSELNPPTSPVKSTAFRRHFTVKFSTLFP